MLFGSSNKEAIKSFYEKGAVVLDVRSPGEFADGHISGSKNIPLPVLSSQIDQVKSFGKPVLVCCLSGGRSANGAKILNEAGIEAINGGGWRALSGIIDN